MEINENGDLVLPSAEEMEALAAELADPLGVDSGPISVYRMLGVPMVGIPDDLASRPITGRELADYILAGARELDELEAEVAAEIAAENESLRG